MLRLNAMQTGVDAGLSHERYLLVLHGHTMECNSGWFAIDAEGFVESAKRRRRIRWAE